MKKYIFLTDEWFTQQPDWKDIENTQVIWISKWNNPKQAFDNLKEDNNWILETSFNKVYCYELENNETEYFYIK